MGLLKSLKRRRGVSRNERAGKFSRMNLPSELSRGLWPRLVLVALFTTCGVLLLPPTEPIEEVLFREGEIADRDVIAPFNFEVPLSHDELRMARANAALTVPPVYHRDRTAERALTRDLTALLDTITTIVNQDTSGLEDKVAQVSSWLPSLSRNTLRVAVDPRSFRILNQATREYQRGVLTRGLIDNASLIRRNGYREITVVEGEENELVSIADVLDQGRLDQVIREEALTRFGKDRDRAQVFFEIVRGHLQPNLMFDSDETNRRRDAATNAVKETFQISKDERIIGKHDKVSREQELMLRALEDTRVDKQKVDSPLTVVSQYTALALRLVLFSLLLGGYLLVFDRRVYSDMGRLGAVFGVVVLYLVFLTVVVRFEMSEYLVPTAFASIMLTALFDFRLGLVIAAFASALIPLLTPITAGAAFVSWIASTVGVVGIGRMRSRSHVHSIFLHVAAAYVIGICAIEMGSQPIEIVARQLLWGVANGMFSSAAVIFLLPVFETLFNRTTRFTLLELTDLNKPILKRLNMEAHGTYHHSMMLGNLVDAAAEQIGADPLRSRVMAYYHDIGKLLKPEYFAENQNGLFNKHEKITPQMSALILVSHVKDGVELAREEKLPELVIDGIREHHGTSVMAYFYQKALETDSHASVKKDDFRYPGPKPRTKESGLLMCADTVEAAVRSLKDPTPAHIRNMVTKLIDKRAQEGELDDSGVTLNDLNVIKEKFITILTGVYHKRIAYPGQDEEESEPSAKGATSGESVAKSV